MKKIYTLTLLCALAMGTISGLAQNSKPSDSKTSKGTIGAAETQTLKATVENIDYDKRQITLKTENGKTRKFEVGPEVQRFSEIKKGDEVRLDYLESIALSLKTSDSKLPPTGRADETIQRSPGKTPGGAAVSVVEVSATVVDVDRDKHQVTLRGPAGNEDTIKVDPEVGDLKNVKKGDQVTVRYTQAMAISIQRGNETSSSSTTKPTP